MKLLIVLRWKNISKNCVKNTQKPPKIQLILDQESYNTSKETLKAAEKYGIILHYLPPYSPNLNSIKLLWKVMNEHVRNNCYFASARDFKRAIMDFFKETWNKIALLMLDRINDNFPKYFFIKISNRLKCQVV